jgi:ribosomal protein L11 methyltransferase
VLDMGCGTGILAIFSELLGAKEILAVDNDEWAVNNTIENIRKNKCKNINVMSGEVEVLENLSFDVILANINRNVLLQDIQHYRSGLTDKGKLILSGFYTDDLSIIENETKKHGLQLKRKVIKNNWIAAEFWSD